MNRTRSRATHRRLALDIVLDSYWTRAGFVAVLAECSDEDEPAARGDPVGFPRWGLWPRNWQGRRWNLAGDSAAFASKGEPFTAPRKVRTFGLQRPTGGAVEAIDNMARCRTPLWVSCGDPGDALIARVRVRGWSESWRDRPGRPFRSIRV
jgi:hypothetical protein